MAFDPGYATNHRFYVDYTDLNGDTHVVRYTSNGSVGDPTTAKQLLFVKDFAPNHNGGQLQFGPDGRLYWGNGDGGGGGDPHLNGQNLNRPFAKIMRLDVNAAGARWQLVAYGLRNPWRFSFDRANGDLYIGDVGQDKYEEIDYLKRGSGLANFGWNHWEGKHIYSAATPLLKAGHYVPPVVEYPHSEGCSVSGGYVYRGKLVPAATGRYFYGDYCSGTVWSLKIVGGRATSVRREPFKVAGLSCIRRGNDRRAVSDVGQLGQPVPAEDLDVAAPADLGPLRAEGGVGDRLQRFIQVAQLVRDHRQLLAPLFARVQACELLDDPVEPPEQRLELAVCDLAVLHAPSLVRRRRLYSLGQRANGQGTRCKSGTVPPL